MNDALSRRSGVKSVTVKLQDGRVVVETDPTRPVLPADLWREIGRVGFVPAKMEIRAQGLFDGRSFEIDGRKWPLVNAAPAGRRKARLKVVDGGEDPPRVESVD